MAWVSGDVVAIVAGAVGPATPVTAVAPATRRSCGWPAGWAASSSEVAVLVGTGLIDQAST